MKFAIPNLHGVYYSFVRFLVPFLGLQPSNNADSLIFGATMHATRQYIALFAALNPAGSNFSAVPVVYMTLLNLSLWMPKDYS